MVSLLQRQPWMNEDEFYNIRVKIPEVKSLTLEYAKHPHVHKFLKEWTKKFIVETYRGEGEPLTDRRFHNFIKAMRYLSQHRYLTTEIIKHVHSLIMEGEDILVGKYREKPAYAGYTIFNPPNTIDLAMGDAVAKFNSTSDPILAASTLFLEVLSIHPFEDGNGRVSRLLLSHVLNQMGCSLFPVILSSFHTRSRRHVIRALKRRNIRSLYTIVASSVVRVWEEFFLDVPVGLE